MAEEVVPEVLFNLLAWITSASEEAAFDQYAKVSEDRKRRRLSIAQDIIFTAHNGNVFTPKHFSLGLTIRHLFGSSKLINILNGLGHCVSYGQVLEHDTAIAELQLSQGKKIPPGFKEGVFSTFVWDNNDFCEETASGRGTTHNTNGIIIQ